MTVLKRKQEPTTTTSIRIPGSLKAEMDELRKLAEKAGVDFTATLSELVVQGLKTIRSELESVERKPGVHANGTASSPKDA